MSVHNSKGVVKWLEKWKYLSFLTFGLLMFFASRCRCPYFETTCLLVANLTAWQTLHDIGLGALISLMANLIALEAKLGVAIKWIVRILTAEDAVWATAFIGTLICHVTKLLAIATLDRGVGLDVVTCQLILHLREHVVLHLFILFARRL